MCTGTGYFDVVVCTVCCTTSTVHFDFNGLIPSDPRPKYQTWESRQPFGNSYSLRLHHGCDCQDFGDRIAIYFR